MWRLVLTALVQQQWMSKRKTFDEIRLERINIITLGRPSSTPDNKCVVCNSLLNAYRHERIYGSRTNVSLGRQQSTETMYVWSPTGWSCIQAQTHIWERHKHHLLAPTTVNPNKIYVVTNRVFKHTGMSAYMGVEHNIIVTLA